MIFDSPEWRQARDTKLLTWMLDDNDAVDFLVTMFHIGEVWDDLIDRDKPISDEQINAGFVAALFELTANPFFQRHHHYLRPVMMSGVNGWLDSVHYEKYTSDTHWKHWAFVLRNWYMDIVPACAFLVGGFDHMRFVSLEARKFFQTESLEQYLAEFESA